MDDSLEEGTKVEPPVSRVEPPMFRTRPVPDPVAQNIPDNSSSAKSNGIEPFGNSWLMAAAASGKMQLPHNRQAESNRQSDTEASSATRADFAKEFERHSGAANDVNSPQSTNSNSQFGERRSSNSPSIRTIGNVVCCSGSKIVISAEANNQSVQQAGSWSVGQFISIKGETGRVVAMIREMRTDDNVWNDDGINKINLHADLLGEVNDDSYGNAHFKRGVSQYPAVGAIVHKIRGSDLECIYDLGDRQGVVVGELSQNLGIPAMVAIDDLLRRHVAIVGTTGVGKSCAVSLVVLKALAADKNLRVVMLDPHNEFAGAFGAASHSLDQNNLDLPFWLLNYDELEDVIFRGRPVAEESDILREIVVQAKIERTNGATDKLRRPDSHSINVDTPVPYRISDVVRFIDEILGQLEPRFSRLALRSLKVRIEIIENNPRYAFMFGRSGRDDNFETIVANIFRLPANGKPMATINLSGLPSEVVNSVASVVARLSFEVARGSNGAVKVLLVCEEAHRYVPSDSSLGFLPTRRAISRIAKEGRKYGCAIAVVTQRPGELDQTILSQCSTIFAMRLTNDRDQEIIRSALSDSSSSVISFLSSLDNREAIAFGEGVSVPMRLRFADHDLASRRNANSTDNFAARRILADDVDPRQLVEAMRGVEAHAKEIATNKLTPVEDVASATTRSGLVRPGANINDIIAKTSALQSTNLLRK